MDHGSSPRPDGDNLTFCAGAQWLQKPLLFAGWEGPVVWKMSPAGYLRVRAS